MIFFLNNITKYDSFKESSANSHFVSVKYNQIIKIKHGNSVVVHSNNNFIFRRFTSSGNVLVDLMFAVTEILWNSYSGNGSSSDDKGNLVNDLTIQPINQLTKHIATPGPTMTQTQLVNNNKIYINHIISTRIFYYEYLKSSYKFKEFYYVDSFRQYNWTVTLGIFKDKRVFFDITPPSFIFDNNTTINIPIPNISSNLPVLVNTPVIHNEPIMLPSMSVLPNDVDNLSFGEYLVKIGFKGDLTEKTGFVNCYILNTPLIDHFFGTVFQPLFKYISYSEQIRFLTTIFNNKHDPVSVTDLLMEICDSYVFTFMNGKKAELPYIFINSEKFEKIFNKPHMAEKNTMLFDALNESLFRCNLEIRRDANLENIDYKYYTEFEEGYND